MIILEVMVWVLLKNVPGILFGLSMQERLCADIPDPDVKTFPQNSQDTNLFLIYYVNI